MRVLLLRFDAPLMSFGGVQVDQRGVTSDVPSKSMLTGLLANALGYEHKQAQLLSRLQDRIQFAVRQDRSGQALTDYQTVDLGQEFMRQGWTSRGALEGRKGGSAKTGTHIRYREYLADAVYTVALHLRVPEERPTHDELATALASPARPLFIGRKPCLPARRILLDVVEAESALQALERLPPASSRADSDEVFLAWWDDPAQGEAQIVPVTDERDWANQIHVGRRLLRTGTRRYQEVRS